MKTTTRISALLIALGLISYAWAQQGVGIQGGIVNLGFVTGSLGVANGGSGVTSISGVLHGNGTSAFSAANVSLTSEVTGTLTATNGGTGQTSATDDSVLLGNGTAFAVAAIPNCTDTRGQHLSYTASTNAFSCGTSNSLVGTSASLGGGALLAGACASNDTTVSGATTSMVAIASPITYPGNGAVWSAQVSAANTVTTRVCATIAVTPTASVYNIRVIQ